MQELDSEILRLSVHHIGGRGNSRSFPATPFESNIENVIYEADETCEGELREYWGKYPSKLVVHSQMVGRESGSQPFNIHGSRYCSSIFPFTDKYKGKYSNDLQFGWDSDPLCHEIDETLNLEVKSLDEIVYSETCASKPPEYLSLDVEGGELEILQGAAQSIKDNIIAIYTEVSFEEVYEGQPLFEDIRNFMFEKGFELADLKIFSEVAAFSDQRIKVGLRGQGAPVSGEALFIKKKDKIIEDHRYPTVDLLKCALIQFLYFKFDDMWSTLNAWKEQKGEQYDYQKSLSLQFMIELLKVSETYPSVSPVSYTEIFPTYEDRKVRTKDSNESIQRIEAEYPTIRSRYFSRVDENIFHRALPTLLSEEEIGVELLCKQAGFEKQADEFKRIRLHMIKKNLMRLGMQVVNK